MRLKTLVFHLLLCQYLLQRTTSKIVNNDEWIAPGCCQNCPNLNNVIRASDNQQYVKICQHGTAGHNSHFATLFDTVNRIPVFSKFTVYNNDLNIRRPDFMYEAQLVGETNVGNIGSFEIIRKLLNLKRGEVWGKIGRKQAIKSDYTGTGFDKGHLRPHAGCQSIEATIATYTYTNVVPQLESFNRGGLANC